MLDLNFYVINGDSMEDHDNPGDSATKLEDSKTSKSSIVNSEEAPALSSNGKDEDSSTTANGFIFDILKKKKDSENASSELVTRPLFPVAGKGRAWDSWLNLSFSDSGDGVKEVNSHRKKQPLVKKSRRGPRSRSSEYRGVTFYRRTGRWESHIWDCGKQVYLGGFDTAHAAARAYDRAAIKFRGIDADINFNTSDYEEDMKQTKNLTKEEFVFVLRRHGSRFSRPSSNIQGEDLDLSLGISKSSEDSVGNERMRFMDFHFNGGDKLNAERTKDHCSLMDGSDTSRVDGPRRQPQTAAMVSDQTAIFGCFQALHQSSSSSSSSSSLMQNGFSNGALSLKKSGVVSLVSINAASSGFPSFAAHRSL